MTIIEGLCYLHPHKREIVATHPAMRGVWMKAVQLAQQNNSSYLAPLLVDDIEREGGSPHQSVQGILTATTGRNFSSLPWFGSQVMESDIEKQYGNLGCKIFDAIYHRDIMLSLYFMSTDWKWIVVHPYTFKSQQSGMLQDLWKLIMPSEVYLSDEKRGEARKRFLEHFTHIWIDDEGQIESQTTPKYVNKKVIHA